MAMASEEQKALVDMLRAISDLQEKAEELRLYTERRLEELWMFVIQLKEEVEEKEKSK